MALPSLVYAMKGARSDVLIPLFLLVLFEFYFFAFKLPIKDIKSGVAARARAAQPSFGFLQL